MPFNCIGVREVLDAIPLCDALNEAAQYRPAWRALRLDRQGNPVATDPATMGMMRSAIIRGGIQLNVGA